MDLGMTVRTSRIICLLRFRGRCSADPVGRVALQTEVWLSHEEQIVVDRSMRCMADPAVFHDVRMFIQERPLFFGMTLGADRLYRVPPQAFLGTSTVRLMAVGAEHSFLGYRVVVRKRERCPNIGMAFGAQVCHLTGPHLQVVAAMDRVAIGTGHIGGVMFARIPVVQVEGRVGRMAFETNKRLCLGRQVFNVNEGFIITGRSYPCLLVSQNSFGRQAIDRKTSRTVAAFTVHKR